MIFVLYNLVLLVIKPVQSTKNKKFWDTVQNYQQQKFGRSVALSVFWKDAGMTDSVLYRAVGIR